MKPVCNLDDVEIRAGCPNQSAYIVIDQSTGERTIFWHRPDCLAIDPAHITPEKITCARMLHVDGHDTPAVARAARIARDHGIPVSVDVDNVYPGFDQVLACVDYLVGSTEFPARWTGERDPFRALERIQNEYGMRVAAMTLGRYGALAREDGRFVYSPGFVVNCVDTTGAGDVFHGAFCYSVLKGATVRDALEFSNAMAALNCTRLGARGGIATADEARDLIAARRAPLPSRFHSHCMIPLRSSERVYSRTVVTGIADRDQHRHISVPGHVELLPPQSVRLQLGHRAG